MTAFMLSRVGVIALNTYREAVRARILMGLFGVALATAAYAMVVASYTSQSALRVLSDIGTFSMSAYAVVVAIVLGASALYRELELKTIFPIIARPIRRGEYLFGKFCGAQITLTVFLAANAGVVMCCLAIQGTDRLLPQLFLLLSPALFLLGLLRAQLRTWLPMVWAVVVFAGGYWLSRGQVDDQRVVLSAVCLAFLEVAIVTALATFFSAFTSPFLTAVLTGGVFVVGRSADTLAKLPERVFGPVVHQAGVVLSRVFPNLMVYVPPRSLLTGETADIAFLPYLGFASVQAVGWVVALLGVAAFMFRRRDFT